MTRAREHLHLVLPTRLFRTRQHRHAEGNVLTARSRFLPDGTLHIFERHAHSHAVERSLSARGSAVRVDVAAGIGRRGISQIARLFALELGMTYQIDSRAESER